MENDLVPVNSLGKLANLEFSVETPSPEEAFHYFLRAAKRMQNPSIWRELAGWASASFALIGSDGVELRRLAREGDYIRIDVPGPGPLAGGGFDWVRVEKMEEYFDPKGSREWTGMRVRPAGKPGKGGEGTAHFFRSDATSSFIIERKDNKVIGRYHGRNEVPNTGTEKKVDNLRNALVAAGAIIRLSEAQWSALIKGFMAEEIGGEPCRSAG